MKHFFSALTAFLGTLPAVALAAVPYPPIECPPGLVGCGSGPANVIQDNVTEFGQLLVNIAGGAGVVFIAWAGFQMMTAMGDDGKLSQQKWAVLYVLGGLAVAALAQSLVSFVGTQNYGQGSNPQDLPVNLLGNALSIILTLFNAVFGVMIIVGGVRMVYAQGKSDEFNTGRKMIVWAIIGAVVTNLANALVQALATIFGA